MQSQNSNSLTDIVNHLSESNRLSVARLMSPAEVRAAVSTRLGPESSANGWHICTEVHPSLWKLVASTDDKLLSKGTIAMLNSGLRRLVLLQQIQNWRHHLIFPLTGSSAKSGLESTQQAGTMHLSLARGDFEEAFLMHVPLSRSLLAALGETIHSIETNGSLANEVTTYALRTAMAALHFRGAMPIVAKDVGVSIVVPDELAALAAMKTSAIAGHKPN
ncbi:MAG: hypothetical protein V4488_02750 [Pseudomonadota bacterium]